MWVTVSNRTGRLSYEMRGPRMPEQVRVTVGQVEDGDDDDDDDDDNDDA